jgi:hypothetical protein
MKKRSTLTLLMVLILMPCVSWASPNFRSHSKPHWLPLRHTKNSPRKEESIPWLVISLPLLQTSCLALPADAEVVARFYDVFLLLLATGFFPVDRLHCFGNRSLSKWPLSFVCVVAP